MTDEPTTSLPDLAVDRLGGAAILANDEFFAGRDNLVRATTPVWDADRYTDRGKWMDGWETRRRRVPGDDWCIVRLGVPGILRHAVVDTAYFTGNHPPEASLDGCHAPPDADPTTFAEDDWVELLPRVDLRGGHANGFELEPAVVVSHVRLRIYPDGGVARLRLHGEAVPDWLATAGRGRPVDLASVATGGRIVDASDRYFSDPINLLYPDASRGMHDGWETRRRRDDSNDWVEVQLGAPGTVERVVVDTSHFKGNAPGACRLQGRDVDGAWTELVARGPLQPHTVHTFEVTAGQVVDRVRLDIYPDGGLARLRVLGTIDGDTLADRALTRLDHLPAPAARAELLTCCGSKTWADAMTARRPFGTRERLLTAADAAWAELGRDAILEAFDAHPRIGQREADRATGTKASSWSSGEQAGVADDDRAALLEVNRAYEDRFGWIFLICATGLDSGTILEQARGRMGNDPDAELDIAAEEQRRITALRLHKLLGLEA